LVRLRQGGRILDATGTLLRLCGVAGEDGSGRLINSAAL